MKKADSGIARHNIVSRTNEDKKLLRAAERGAPQEIKEALDNEANIEVRAPKDDNNHMTPLQLAVLKLKKDNVVYLVEQKADVNAVDSQQQTALHILAQVRDENENRENINSIFNLLISRGIDISATNKDGKSALDLFNERKGNCFSDVKQTLTELLNQSTSERHRSFR